MNRKSLRASIVIAAALMPLLGACTQSSDDESGGTIPQVDAAAGGKADGTAGGAARVDLKTQMQLTAGEYLQGAMEDTFTPEQVTLLQIIAHQNVIGETCDGFEVDKDKWAAEMAALAKTHAAETGKDSRRIHDELLLGTGLAVGSELTVAAYDTQAFCDAARADRADGGQDEHNIFVSPPTS